MSESEREGGEQHCRHSPTVTAPQPEDRGSNSNSGSAYDGGRRPCHPYAAQSPSLTASLWDHPAKLGVNRGEKGESYSRCPSQDHKYRTSTPAGLITHHTHSSHCFSLSYTHIHLLTPSLSQTEAHFTSCCLFGLAC